MLDFATVYTVAFFVTLPDALRLSGLHDLCNILNLRGFQEGYGTHTASGMSTALLCDINRIRFKGKG